jgi:hypothetical protein
MDRGIIVYCNFGGNLGYRSTGKLHKHAGMTGRQTDHPIPNQILVPHLQQAIESICPLDGIRTL